MAVRVGALLVPESEILSVDLSGLERLEVVVRTRSGVEVTVREQPAIDLIMRVCPSAVEGRRLRFVRHAWAFHNLVAHPAMQILTWFGCRDLGLRVHDATVPRPVGRR